MLLAIAAGLIYRFLGSATTTEFRLAGRYESERANAFLIDKLRGPDKSAEIVIVQSQSLTVDDEAFRAKVEAVHGEIVGLGPGTISGGIRGQPLFHYYNAIDAGPLVPPEQLQQLLPLLVSADRRTTLIHYTLAGTSQEATANVEDVLHKVEEANEGDDFLVLIGGDASIAFENNELSAEDLEKGERIGVPVALIILLALFGAVAATLLPLGLAIVAIAIALAAVAVIGQAFELLFFVTMMITMIGLAVGIDYSLLIVSRFREEMDRGLDTREAVERAGGTAGPHGAVQRNDRGAGPDRHAHCPRIILPVPWAGGYPGDYRRSGRHVDTLARRAIAARPQGEFPDHPFPDQVLA